VNYTARFAVVATLFLAGCPGITENPDTTLASVVEGINHGGAECGIPQNNDVLVQQVVDLVNEERAQRGIPPVTVNPVLNEIAEAYACELIDLGFFDHINPYTLAGPGQRAIEGGYFFKAIGENLAGGQITPDQVMREWMESTRGHRENILRADWDEVGVAVRTGGEHGVYWVQEFGDPQPQTPR
jgi:uncharacterized protein YkwD